MAVQPSGVGWWGGAGVQQELRARNATPNARRKLAAGLPWHPHPHFLTSNLAGIICGGFGGCGGKGGRRHARREQQPSCSQRRGPRPSLSQRCPHPATSASRCPLTLDAHNVVLQVPRAHQVRLLIRAVCAHRGAAAAVGGGGQRRRRPLGRCEASPAQAQAAWRQGAPVNLPVALLGRWRFCRASSARLPRHGG